ncbi:MAG: ABC transporter permease [Acidobacteriota bacterium]
MENLWNDLSYGARMLARNPGFTIVAVLSLAIGIGANSTIFSVTNALLLRPLPYKNADRIAILWNRSPGLNIAQDWFSPGQYLDIKSDNRVFEKVAVTIGASFNLTGLGVPEHVDGARVSSSFFPLLGTNALHGRVFSDEEDVPGKPPGVILGYRFWERYFSSDPAAVGRTLTLNGNNLTIIGVMPADFALNKEVMPAVNGIENADLLLPLPMAESARANRGNEDFNIFARLKPGVSVTQAQADMDLLAARMKQQYPGNYPANGGLTISVVPLLSQVVGDIRLALIVVFGAVGFVLLIACANVANLLLARASVRQKEIAIRTAVGASLRRLLTQLLTESVLLALIGGIVGLMIAALAVKALRVFGPENIPRLDEIGVDGRVIAFTFIVSLVTGVVFGLAPALRASRIDPNEVLKDGGRGTSSSRSHQRTRKLLVIAEVALSLVLLISAGLLIRSYQRIGNAHPGFNSTNVLSLRLSLPASKYQKPEATAAFFKQTVERLERLPGVEAAGTTYSLPMSTVAFAWEPISIEGYVPKAAGETIISNVRIVSPGYFRSMKISLIKGRYFDERDVKGQGGELETAIIDEALAGRFWPNEDPIGRRMQRGTDGPWRTVVGVISDAKEFSPEKEPPIAVYYPAGQVISRNMYLVVRTTSDPGSRISEITKEIQAVDSQLPVFDVKTMNHRLYESLAQRRFAMFLLGVLAVIALVLSAIGIYGVMSYSVTQRTQEIGIRIALGAQPGRILQLVIRQAIVLVASGVVMGMAGAVALTWILSSLLYGVTARDRWTFLITPLLLAAIALLASYIPARRAAKVDPMVALRCE